MADRRALGRGYIASLTVRKPDDEEPGQGQAWVRSDVELVAGEDARPTSSWLHDENGPVGRAQEGLTVRPFRARVTVGVDRDADGDESDADQEDCLLVKVHAPTIQDLEETLDRFLLHGQTVTSIVVSTPVAARPLPL